MSLVKQIQVMLEEPFLSVYYSPCSGSSVRIGQIELEKPISHCHWRYKVVDTDDVFDTMDRAILSIFAKKIEQDECNQLNSTRKSKISKRRKKRDDFGSFQQRAAKPPYVI